MSDTFRILVINPGSTSTKLALFEGKNEIHSMNCTHSVEDLIGFSSVVDQEEFRFNLIKEFLNQIREDAESPLDAAIGRGGLLKPLEGGIYRVGQPMVEDLRSARFGEHACNLGAVLAQRLANEESEKGRPCEAFIADPVVVDELCDEARISGMPELERKSIFHALNQKSVAREVALKLGKDYEEVCLIVAHLGGGVSVGAHRNGKVIDVNNALNGEGPFSPERSGSLPAGQLSELIFSGRFSPNEIMKKITGKGGLFAYCGTKDLRELLKTISSGDEKAEIVYRAMVLQISQEIARHGATLEGRVDGIILTGGLAYSTDFVEELKKKISFLGKVFVIPGEREMTALADNALDALSGCRLIKEYD
jgi:butyrate kinase